MRIAWSIAVAAALVAGLAIYVHAVHVPAGGGGGSEARRVCRELLTVPERGVAQPRRNVRRQARSAERAPIPYDGVTGEEVGNATLRFSIADVRRPVMRRQAFALPRAMRAARVRVHAPWADLATADGRAIPNAQVAAYVSRRGPARTVLAAICVNPSSPTRLEPGTYDGTARVGVGKRLKTVKLSVDVEATPTPVPAKASSR